MVFHEQDSLPMNFPKKMHIEISPKTESHAKQLKVMLCPLLHENYLIWGNNTQALEGHGPDGAIHVEHEAHLLDSVLIQRQRERKLCPIFAEFFAFLPGMATVRTYTLFLRANTSGRLPPRSSDPESPRIRYGRASSGSPMKRSRRPRRGR